MIDYLLQFPDKDAAIAFGVDQGYTYFDDEGEAVTKKSTQHYYMSIIGQHLIPTGEVHVSPFGDIPIKEPDGKHWILFRDITGNIDIPSGADQYIVWRSDSGEDRPVDAPDRFFA